MPRFTFRYAVPLRQAVTHEQACQRQLAELLRAKLIFEGQLRQMQQTISDAKHQLGERLTGSVDLKAVGEVARFAGDSTIRGREIVQRLAELERRISAARQTLLEATQRRRSFELLRDRDERAWKKQQQRKESAVLDEVAARGHALRAPSLQANRTDLDLVENAA